MGNCVGNPSNKNARPGGKNSLKVPSARDSQKKSSQILEAKIVIIGASSVGKTCIANRYQFGKFDSTYSATVGAAFYEKKY